MNKLLNTRISNAFDSKENWDKIKDTTCPLDGEFIVVTNTTTSVPTEVKVTKSGDSIGNAPSIGLLPADSAQVIPVKLSDGSWGKKTYTSEAIPGTIVHREPDLNTFAIADPTGRQHPVTLGYLETYYSTTEENASTYVEKTSASSGPNSQLDATDVDNNPYWSGKVIKFASNGYFNIPDPKSSLHPVNKRYLINDVNPVVNVVGQNSKFTVSYLDGKTETVQMPLILPYDLVVGANKNSTSSTADAVTDGNVRLNLTYNGNDPYSSILIKGASGSGVTVTSPADIEGSTDIDVIEIDAPGKLNKTSTKQAVYINNSAGSPNMLFYHIDPQVRPNSIVSRTNGYFYVNDPTEDRHPISKKYGDETFVKKSITTDTTVTDVYLYALYNNEPITVSLNSEVNKIDIELSPPDDCTEDSSVIQSIDLSNDYTDDQSITLTFHAPQDNPYMFDAGQELNVTVYYTIDNNAINFSSASGDVLEDLLASLTVHIYTSVYVDDTLRKKTSKQAVYINSSDGTPAMLYYGSGDTASAHIVSTTPSGYFNVLEPTSSKHPTTKLYVDTNLSTKIQQASTNIHRTYLEDVTETIPAYSEILCEKSTSCAGSVICENRSTLVDIKMPDPDVEGSTITQECTADYFRCIVYNWDGSVVYDTTKQIGSNTIWSFSSVIDTDGDGNLITGWFSFDFVFEGDSVTITYVGEDTNPPYTLIQQVGETTNVYHKKIKNSLLNIDNKTLVLNSDNQISLNCSTVQSVPAVLSDGSFGYKNYTSEAVPGTLVHREPGLNTFAINDPVYRQHPVTLGYAQTNMLFKPHDNDFSFDEDTTASNTCLYGFYLNKDDSTISSFIKPYSSDCNGKSIVYRTKVTGTDRNGAEVTSYTFNVGEPLSSKHPVNKDYLQWYISKVICEGVW